MRQSKLQHPVAHRRGSALVMCVLISVILTGLVLTIALSSGTQAQMTGAGLHLDQANMAAEAAGQIAVWQFKKDNSWRQLTAPSTLPTLSIGTNTFSYSTVCTDAGAVATLYWPFSEGSGITTADVSGHNNTGTLVGGVTWVTGRYGDALQFNGVDGYVDAGHDPSTDIVGPVTMSAWVKMNSAAQDQKVGANQDGVAGGYKMSIYGQKVEFEVRDINNNPTLNRYISGGTIIPTNVWYHLAGVYNPSNGTITTYVNGVLDRQMTGVASDALVATAGNFQIGREPWFSGGNNRYFNGTIDDVRVYNRALSATEIKTLANTSIHVRAVATLTGSSAMGASGAVDFICSAPTPLPPIAPALTVGGSMTMKNLTVLGDVQGDAAITVNGTSAVTGHVTYGTSFSDPSHYLTVTYQGKTITPTKNASATCPTINYANIISQAAATYTGGSNQSFTFTEQSYGAAIIVVNGNCTDPVLNTSDTGGTLLVTGNLTITKNTTWGAAGLPAYIIVEGNVTQTGTLNLSGALYVKGNWTHTDATINGDVCIGGTVTDNTATSSTFTVSGIPWFDPRASAAGTPQPLFYASYEGVTP